MGDGGFWHNGLLSGVTARLLNKSDGLLVIMKNGYTSATGTQDLVSTPHPEFKRAAGGDSHDRHGNDHRGHAAAASASNG
ncbi:MAG: hypothetical protein V9G24_14530 [Rhodoblastus sp.]